MPNQLVQHWFFGFLSWFSQLSSYWPLSVTKWKVVSSWLLSSSKNSSSVRQSWCAAQNINIRYGLWVLRNYTIFLSPVQRGWDPPPPMTELQKSLSCSNPQHLTARNIEGIKLHLSDYFYASTTSTDNFLQICDISG